MNHWMWAAISLVGILSTAVVCGTDMFFLTIGRLALRFASPSAGTEVMGFFHMFADARMPIWGVSAILSNLLLVVLSGSGQRWFYFGSLLMLILFVARCVPAYSVPRVASRFGVNVAGALSLEESGAFERWISTSPVLANIAHVPVLGS
jgi:hypothetical protein